MNIDAKAIGALYRTTLDGPDNAVGFVLWRVMHRYQRAVDRLLAQHDLTHLQFTTLAMVGWLCRSGEPTTQAELARQADIHPMQVSLMLKALEAKGMVQRERSTTDSRTLLVAVSPAGLAALEAAFPIVVDLQRRMFGAAGAPGGMLLGALLEVARREAPRSP